MQKYYRKSYEKIEVESELGKVKTFAISLPIKKAN